MLTVGRIPWHGTGLVTKGVEHSGQTREGTGFWARGPAGSKVLLNLDVGGCPFLHCDGVMGIGISQRYKACNNVVA